MVVGVALGLFGVTQGSTERGSESVGKRCDIHVLVVGDPGMGKSQVP
jgi:DNA replicative helicase MCM subunit Mcm2 (Cdc46/Mcm family)